MDLRDYIRVLRRRWRFVALLTLLALCGATGASFLATAQYEAHTQFFVSTPAQGGNSDLLQGSSFTQQRVKSYADVVTSPAVLEPVIEGLDLAMTASVLANSVTAEAPVDTVLINVAVRSETPQLAMDIANGIGDSFAAVVADLERPPGGGESPVSISTVETATEPQSPITPNVRLNIALSLCLGLVVGVGAALLREILDAGVTSEEDVKSLTDASMLGGILFDPGAKSHPLIVQTDPHGGRAEAFRQLRTNLQFVAAANHPKSFVVTSSIPGEGKSTTACNLAITMAASGARVCLVEGDLRRPKAAEYLGLEAGVGLTTVLIGQAELSDVLQEWGDGHLFVLPSGELPPNPSELLGSSAMEKLLQQLEEEFDTVIIDAPPLLAVTDAAVLTRLADGAVVVVGSDKVNRDQLRKALGNLESVDGVLLGFVMNFISHRKTGAFDYYNYGYSARTDSPASRPPTMLPDPASKGARVSWNQ